MEEKFLTILTPTYNRGEKLQELYESIKRQINKNFVWYIIDDGSKDGTGHIVREFQREQVVDVIYEKRENGGKHRAINQAMKSINSELTMIVDSDDLLLPDATETIFQDWIENAERGIVGLVYLRGHNGFEPIGKQWQYDKMYGSTIDLTVNKGVSGDKAEVMQTSILKEFPFPEFEKEKFCSESVVWLAIAKKYQIMTRNKIIYITKYLDGGLSKSGRKMQVNNPLGAMENAKVCLDSKFGIKLRVKNALLFDCYGMFAGKKLGEIMKESPKKLLTFGMYIPAMVLRKKWAKYEKRR